MNRLLNLLFRCRHRDISNVFHQSYVVCLNCGQRFEYDWKAMRIGAKMEANANV